VFDKLKQKLLDVKLKKAGHGTSPESLSAFDAFLLGALSKSIATVLTYPAIRFVNYDFCLSKNNNLSNFLNNLYQCYADAKS
jgi:hypothetical protein